ncbi:MAG: SLC13 family permease [Proteobacteria bacterium]|nr:SLC13 family permease [Pseudomonadota bacterium]
MDLATLSLCTIVLVVGVSIASKINVGWLAILAASVLGLGFGKVPLEDILRGFPTELFLTILGVTFLFGQAQLNGTLEAIVKTMLRWIHTKPTLLPLALFGISAVISGIGAGNIATTALIAPLAMTLARDWKLSPFLVAIMVGNGANAGALSPLAPTGVLMISKLKEFGLAEAGWSIFCYSLVIHAVVSLAAYWLCRGYRVEVSNVSPSTEPVSFQRVQWRTIVVLAGVFIFAAGLQWPLALVSLSGGVLLSILSPRAETEIMRSMPWGSIIMVSGVVLLVSLAEKLGGLGLLADLMTQYSTKGTMAGTVAFVSGFASIFSSSSGVVIPTFLPMVPGLIDRMGSGDSAALATSIAVAAHLVDVSPLSTIGALCISAVPATGERDQLFNKMLAWGLSMAVVGALLCFLWFDVF